MTNSFDVIIPAEVFKSDDGEYRIRGLASTQKLDKEGEIIIQSGVDLTPIDEGCGVLNWDHEDGPENTVGLLDGYTKVKDAFYIEGRLFKKHDKARAVKQIIDSLGERDKGRMGLSVQGKIVKRNSANPKIIERCVIDKVALTLNPVNTDTYVDLVKSMTSSETDIAFHAVQETSTPKKSLTYTSEQVIDLLTKALGLGGGGIAAPNTRSGGDALAVESFGTKKKKKKKDKIKKADTYEKGLGHIMGQLQILYPDYTKEVLWSALKERLTTKIPNHGSS